MTALTTELPTPSPVHDRPPEPSPDVLGYPSGTGLRFLALIAAVLLAATFVGNWFYLSVRAPSDDFVPPTAWLVAPPMLVLLGALALTLAAPRWLERRRGWTVVPADRGGRAIERFDALAAEAGLRTTPTLTWNDTAAGSAAVAYGFAGAYRVAITPALVGAGRRSPATFDAVLRHELAHIRHRDVTLTYFAVCVWYALLPVLAAPLVWRVIDRDVSLVPDYLVRVAILALLIYATRAAVLRCREHYADVRASVASGTDVLAALLRAPSRRHDLRGLVSLHPSPEGRVLVVNDPDRLARLHPVEFFTIGLTATWALPLLQELLTHGDAASVVRAAQVSRWALFGMVGAYTGAVLVRWAGTGGERGTFAGASGLVAGLCAGSVISLANTALDVNAGAEIGGAAVTALVCGAYVPWMAELARAAARAASTPARRRALSALCAGVTAGVFALVADASLHIAELIRLGGASLLETSLVEAITSRRAGAVLAAVVVAAGVVAWIAQKRRARAWVVLALGVGSGLVACAVLAGVHLRVRQSSTGLDAVLYYTATVWTLAAAGVVAAMAHGLQRSARRLTTALPVAISIVVASAAWVIVEDIAFGSTLGAANAMELGRDVASLAALFVPVGVLAVWAPATRFTRRRRPRRPVVPAITIAMVTAVLAVIAVVAVVAMPRAVTATTPTPLDDELEFYVGNQVQFAVAERDTAVEMLELVPSESADASARIRLVVLSFYDNALRFARTGDLTSADARRVRHALEVWLEAERTEVATLADAMDGREPWSEYEAAGAFADDARRTWLDTHQRALASRPAG